MLNLLVVVLSALLIAFAWLWANQRSLLYVIDNARPIPGVGLLSEDGREIELHTVDGLVLPGWFLASAAAGSPGPAVIVFAGNAGNRSDRLELGEALTARGYHVLLFDYRGYAHNPGDPTEPGLRADAHSALAALRAQPEVDPARIAYFGESLGAAVAVGLALDEPPAALVLRSPFSSLRDVARHHYPYLPIGEALLFDRYPVREQIAALEVPTLVIGTEADSVVPLAQSRAVAIAAPRARWVEIDSAGHNDPSFSAAGPMVDALVEHLEQHLR